MTDHIEQAARAAYESTWRGLAGKYHPDSMYAWDNLQSAERESWYRVARALRAAGLLVEESKR